MKKTFAFFLCICFVLCAKADHITGGEMYYTCTGFSNGEYHYSGTLKLFMRCNSGRQFADPTIISVFDRVTGVNVKDITVPLSNQETISVTSNNPCITDPPLICYVTGFFYFTVSLPASTNGYLLSSQVNFRIAGINNFGSYVQVGATYTTEIPGTLAAVPDAPKNTAAHFTGSDLVTVCADNTFSYSFGATDADGDELRYSFCNAYAGGNGGSGAVSSPASAPPYVSVPYGLPDFSGGSPLGSRVQINNNSGMITGIAPEEGKYVVTVCVQEIRAGVVIATQRKDLQINIASCTIAAATLKPLYTLCHDTKTITLENNSTSSLIKSYDWQLLNAGGNIIFNSKDPTPNFTFPDTGQYLMKLTVNKNDLCSDSATAPVKVYPGLTAKFTSAGICINNPTIFTDASTSVYGVLNGWKWDFGEIYNFDDNSTDKNTSYIYPTQGNKNVRLIITDSKGCADTSYEDVAIVDKPPITIAFRDSLICVTDNVQLNASGSGNFTWTPLINIIGANTGSPTVSPGITTTYFVNIDDNGCKNHDSVTVRVTD
ncbi:MAG: PKD domain-containing protein, partial [Bacteroidota bacterium]